MHVKYRHFLLVLLLALAPGAAWADDGVEFFEKKIRPVLAENCYECHGPKKQKGGLRLDSAAAIEQGGDTGALFVPKKAEESLLITALRYHDKELKMPPPKDGVDRRLPDSQLNDFVTWIDSGAALPSAKTSFAQGPHWAFQPLANAAPPPKRSDWSRTDVDAFIAEKLEKAG